MKDVNKLLYTNVDCTWDESCNLYCMWCWNLINPPPHLTPSVP